MIDSLTWIDSAGISTELSDQETLDLQWNITGRFMPPVDLVEDDVPEQDGSRPRLVRVRPRDVALGLTVTGEDPEQLRTLLRQLVRTFNPRRGAGMLRATRPDGSARELTCTYKGGLELQEGFENIVGWQRAVLVLRAHDPYWYDQTPTSVTYSVTAPQPFFPDLALNSDTILGTQIVPNDGDVDAWPIWTVHGPASRFTATNQTTGKLLDVVTALTSEQTLIVDTRPFRKTVRRDDGTNLYAAASQPGSSLWPLEEGDNQILIELPGAGPESYVTLTYARRHLTP